MKFNSGTDKVMHLNIYKKLTVTDGPKPSVRFDHTKTKLAV